jgi:hypothetical protein
LPESTPYTCRINNGEFEFNANLFRLELFVSKMVVKNVFVYHRSVSSSHPVIMKFNQFHVLTKGKGVSLKEVRVRVFPKIAINYQTLTISLCILRF